MPGNANSGRRKAVELRVYEGNRSKTPIGDPPPFQQGDFICPEWMPEVGRQYWAHVLQVVPNVVLKAADQGVLERLCSAYDRWRANEAYCQTNGWTFLKYFVDPTGTEHAEPKRRPESTLAKEAGLEFDRLRGELGMSPSARARLAVPKKSDEKSLLTG